MELRNFSELFAIAGLAVTQPLLDIFGRAPDHLLLRGADRTDIVLFAVIVTLAVPTGLWIVGALTGLASRRLRTAVHSISLTALAGVFLTSILDHLAPRLAAIGFAVLLATGFALLHHRTRGPRVWLAFLTSAPLIFLAVFLFASPVAPLLRESDASASAPIGTPARTVIVLFDELPLPSLLDENLEVDSDLFPNFGRLADTSTWFRQTTTVSNATKFMIPAMLTGDEPAGGTPSSVRYPDNLLTLVGDHVPVTSSEVLSRMCPTSVCTRLDATTGGLPALLGDARHVLGQRLDPRDPEIVPMSDITENDQDDGPRRRRSSEQTAPVDDDEPSIEVGDGIILKPRSDDGGHRRLEDFLATIDDEPGLHFLHLLLPHHAHELLPDGTIYDRADPEPGRNLIGWDPHPRPAELGFQRYLLQLQRTDALLGRIIDQLEDEDRFDDTNLIVLSDHGMGYEPGGPFRGWKPEHITEDHDTALAEILWVPFFVKAAGQTAGAISDDPVRNIDLAPTVADLLDVEIPWDHRGRSAYAGGSGYPHEVGLYIGEDDDRPGRPGPYRTLDRAHGWELLRDRTAGVIAPRTDGARGSERIFRIGPRPDLLGEAVPDGLDQIDVDIDPTSRADAVDLNSGRLPALFNSTTTDARSEEPVAISVNGIIRATTIVYPYGTEWRIDAILPREAFHDGRNELAVHRLPGPSS